MEINKRQALILGKKILVSFIGLIFCGIGVSFFLYAGLGVDPASVFQLGIANVLNISYGSASALMNIVILLLLFFLQRDYINISSIIAIFGIGYTADIFNFLLSKVIPKDLHIVLKLILIFVGLVIMGIGVATYIRANLGVGAVDSVSEYISNKSKLPYKYVRIGGDLVFVTVGYLMGGVVGVGTIVAAFLLGPVIHIVRPTVFKIVDPFIRE